MDEDLAIINRNTRNEKLKNFFVNNKRILISVMGIFIALIISYFALKEYKDKKRIKISDQYNSIIIEYSEKNREATRNALIELINKKDSTYSPLSLYFLIDNNLVVDQFKVNELFDLIIDDITQDKEIKNLIIYKKALFNSNNAEENQLLEIVKPLINSDSVWKDHALYLMAEYFYAKNEKQKSKDFFNQILSLENANQDLKIEAQQRLNRDLSD